MNKKIEKPFHTTRSIGKNFTDKEWWAHCEDVRLGRNDGIAFEYHGFKYNYFDICINPKVAYSWRGKKSYNSIQITISESPEGWAYGLDVCLGASGSSHGCPFVKQGDKDQYQTADAAYEAAVRELCKIRDRRIKDADRTTEVNDEDNDDKFIRKLIGGEFKQAIKAIDALEAYINQPSLFGLL